MPCKTVTYDGSALKMKQSPSKAWFKDGHTNTTSYVRAITMYFTTADVSTFTSDKLIDFSSFISATGGNLGLFTGLSFLGILFSIYDWIQTYFQKRRNHTINEKSIKSIKVASFD